MVNSGSRLWIRCVASRRKPVEGVGQVPSSLFHQIAVWLVMDARDMHVARLQFDDEEDEVAPEPGEGQHLHGEQVGGGHSLPVGLQEGLPARALAPPGSGVEAVLLLAVEPTCRGQDKEL